MNRLVNDWLTERDPWYLRAEIMVPLIAVVVVMFWVGVYATIKWMVTL